MNLRDAVLTVATHEIGVVEVGGQNRGPRVEDYLRAVHLKPGDPWCAAFVAWVGAKAAALLGTDWPLPMVGGCATLGAYAAHEGMLQQLPAVGAVFLKFYPTLNRFAHTGFVVKPDPNGEDVGHWITIEGNTSDPRMKATREGWGVFQRSRAFASSDRFIHWWATTTH